MIKFYLASSAVHFSGRNSDGNIRIGVVNKEFEFDV